jgi:hypothetical protein
MIILAIILSAILLLGFTRLRLRAVRTADGKIRAFIRVGFLRFNLLKAQKKRKAEKKPMFRPETVEELRGKGKPLLRALMRAIRIDRMALRLALAGSDDPFGAALMYGKINIVWGILRPLMLENLWVKREHMEFGLDFNAEKTRWEGELAASISIGRIITVLGVMIKAETNKKGGTDQWKTRKA